MAKSEKRKAHSANDLLRRGNLISIIRQIAFRNTSIINYDLTRRARQFNARSGSAFGAYFNPLRDLAAFKQYSEWDLRPRAAKVFESYRNNLHAFLRFPGMHRLHVEIGQATILIHPVVEEPAEVALDGGFDQPLHILWIFGAVVVGAILADGLLQRIVADHVAQHPPHIRDM